MNYSYLSVFSRCWRRLHNVSGNFELHFSSHLWLPHGSWGYHLGYIKLYSIKYIYIEFYRTLMNSVLCHPLREIPFWA